VAALRAKLSEMEVAAAKSNLVLQADLDQLLDEKEALLNDKERLAIEREELMGELVGGDRGRGGEGG
jgi:hypothetical protein